MGLRERASDYSKTVGSQSGIDLGLELKPDTAEKRVAQEKKPLSLSPSTHENNAPPTTPPLSSADFPENMGHKSRLDAVLNLVEIYKEFGQVRSAKDLWEIVAYSLMAQLGTKYVAIFMEDEMRMELKHALGFTLVSDYSFAANSTLAQALAREKKVLYTDDFIASFSEREEKFITQLNARYAVPVFRYEELRGVILVNPPQGRNTFDSDDLFYLKLCGELLGAMEAQLRLIAGAEKKSTHLERANTYRAYAVDFAVKLGSLDNNEPFKDALENELSLHFPETILLFLTREDFFLRRHTAIGLTGEILAHLEVNLVDSVIEKVKQGATTLTPQDFEASEPLAFLAKYRQVIAHKILHRQEFIALAFIIESDNEKVGALKQMMHTYALQNHISRLRDHATSVLEHADNPIMAIRNFIAACEQNLAKAQEPYAIIVTNIANYTRLHNLYGDALAAEIRDFTRKTLREIMEAQDFATEAYHGHFVSILRQKEAGDAWRLSRVLQKQAGKAYADEDRRPLFQHKIYARPHLSVIPFEMLFKS